MYSYFGICRPPAGSFYLLHSQLPLKHLLLFSLTPTFQYNKKLSNSRDVQDCGSYEA
jgi:hypothetical protein